MDIPPSAGQARKQDDPQLLTQIPFGYDRLQAARHLPLA
jgi:hypothetical protein